MLHLVKFIPQIMSEANDNSPEVEATGAPTTNSDYTKLGLALGALLVAGVAGKGCQEAGVFKPAAPSELMAEIIPNTGSAQDQACAALNTATIIGATVSQCLTDGGTCDYRWNHQLVVRKTDGVTSATFTVDPLFGGPETLWGYTNGSVGKMTTVAFDTSMNPNGYVVSDGMVGINRTPASEGVGALVSACK